MRPLHSSLFYYSNPFLKKKKEQLKLITNQWELRIRKK
jgi:hypothetical protein